jgi:hypothetical protein
MSSIKLEALASLFVEPAKKEDFLKSLKNEGGEYLGDDEVLPLIKAAHVSQLNARRDYGLSKAFGEVEDMLRKAGIEVQKGEKLEAVISKLKKPDEISDEEVMKHPAFTKALEAMKKDAQLTTENAMQNPIVAEKVRKATEEVEKKSATTIQELRADIIRRDEESNDANLRRFIRKEAAALKLNLGDTDELKERRLNTLFILTKTQHKQYKLEGDEMFLANEKGDFLKDEIYGNNKPLKDFLLSITPFDPLVVDPRQSSPPPPRPGIPPAPGSAKFTFAGKTLEEATKDFYNQRLALSADLVKRNELNAAWTEHAKTFQPQ